MKNHKDIYHYMNPYKTTPHFKPLLDSRHLAYLKFRALRIRTSEDTYEYIITNLPYSFSLEDIKACYH